MKRLTRTLLDELAAKAAGSPRRRTHHELHEGPHDLVQRFVVVCAAGSYFRPHRHATRSELATVLRGRLDVLWFDDDGRVLERECFGEGCDAFAWESPAGSWHTLVPASDVGAFLEVKQGPYEPGTSAEFAPWSPAEGDARVPDLQQWLRDARPGDRWPGAGD